MNETTRQDLIPRFAEMLRKATEIEQELQQILDEQHIYTDSLLTPCKLCASRMVNSLASTSDALKLMGRNEIV